MLEGSNEAEEGSGSQSGRRLSMSLDDKEETEREG